MNSMTWSDFYLICFAIGFCFSFFSFVFGGSRFGRLHLPHFHGHTGMGTSSAHICLRVRQRMVRLRLVTRRLHRRATAGNAHVPRWRRFAIQLRHAAAFLAWFGGTGYLLTRFSGSGLAWDCLLPSPAGWSAEESFFCS